jgi:hypothetical protein
MKRFKFALLLRNLILFRARAGRFRAVQRNRYITAKMNITCMRPMSLSELPFIALFRRINDNIQRDTSALSFSLLRYRSGRTSLSTESNRGTIVANE